MFRDSLKTVEFVKYLPPRLKADYKTADELDFEMRIAQLTISRGLVPPVSRLIRIITLAEKLISDTASIVKSYIPKEENKKFEKIGEKIDEQFRNYKRYVDEYKNQLLKITGESPKRQAERLGLYLTNFNLFLEAFVKPIFESIKTKMSLDMSTMWRGVEKEFYTEALNRLGIIYEKREEEIKKEVK
jgi:hypothetical protein